MSATMTQRQMVLSGCCEIFHFDADIEDAGWRLPLLARSLSKLSVPKSFKITAPEQVLNFDFSNEKNKYILKVSPMTQCVLEHDKLPCDTLLKEQHLSESTYQRRSPGLCRIHPGKNTALTVPCEMESECTAAVSHPPFKSTTKMLISWSMQWVNHFVTEQRLTGQVSFDFIQALDGTVCAISATPHSLRYYYVLQPSRGGCLSRWEPLAEPCNLFW